MTKKIRKGIWSGIKRLTRFNYLKVLRLRTSSYSVAVGLAAGVFGGFLPAIPPLPVQSITAFTLALLLRGNKIAALAATWISNPLNWLFFYWVQYQVGKHFITLDTGFNPMSMTMEQLVAVGWRGPGILLIGGVLLGLPASLGTYFVTRPLISAYRKRRALRMLRRRTSWESVRLHGPEDPRDKPE